MTHELKYPLARVKKVIHKWLYLKHDEIIDVMLAVYIANQFQADPLWIIFIAPPSSTKTELLRGFEGHPKVYFLSNLTPYTLISGKLPKGKQDDPSLLLKLSDKILILKDFTTVLSMRSENRQEILSQLREIYDGRYSKAFGTGKMIDWQGHVGFMAACTPVYDRHYGIIGTLGDRFLLYRTGDNDNREMGLQAQRIVGQEDEMRKEIRNAVHKFVNQFKTLKPTHFESNKAINEMIVMLACTCALARCPVERNYRDLTIDYEPQAEGPSRLTKQFMQLGMGLALVHGKNIIDDEIYEILKKVGRDLIPAQRLKILSYLWKEKAFEHFSDWQKTKDIATAISMPTNTTKLKLEDLMIVGLLNRQTTGEAETAAYEWQLNKNACSMMAKSGIFQLNKGNT